MNGPLLLASMTLNDVRITPEMFAPVLDAVKSGFWQIVPYLLTIIGLRVSAWLAPILFRKLTAKK